ncbi:mechanosensitive ion channel family protein [Caulobacter sp. NIBR2454]|uniref:mechanosensitive ion channel family protein n=1 Tax=Caulobacter sp. NIBR2454 TaxID=3015996 RepID=UPI0022B71491|nr:mechanosensitive ion channel domain-containing protein [Caulobacter sp. NIBR2454]
MDHLNANMLAWLENPIISKIGFVVLATVIAVIGIRSLQVMVTRSIKESNSRYRIRKMVAFVGYAILVVVAISTFSDRLGQLSVVLGVASAGIAFSLQEVIASFAGWIAISFGAFYRPGDRVQLGGIKGDVIDIGVLRTTLMEIGDWVGGDIYNGRVVRVANSFVFKEPVYNYSGDFSFLWDEFKIPVRFGSDWRLAQQIIEKAVNDHVAVYEESSAEAWKVLVSKFLVEEARIEPLITLVVTDNWIEFTARYVVDYRKRRITKDAIMRSLLTAFEENKPSVGFGSATYEIVAVPPVALRTAPGSASSVAPNP